MVPIDCPPSPVDAKRADDNDGSDDEADVMEGLLLARCVDMLANLPPLDDVRIALEAQPEASW